MQSNDDDSDNNNNEPYPGALKPSESFLSVASTASYHSAVADAASLARPNQMETDASDDAFAPPPPPVEETPIQRAVNGIFQFPKDPPFVFIQPLFTDNHQQTADVCYKILVAVCARTNKNARQGHIYNSMCLHLKPEASRLLKIRVIADSPFKLGRIHALQRSDYPAVSPFIICDQIFHDRTSSDAIKAFVNDPTKISRSDVERVVRFIADNHDDPGAVFEKLSSINIFHNLELQQVTEMLTLKRVRHFASLICKLARIPLPSSMKKVAVKFCLQPMVDAFQRHEMEIDDLYSYVRELISYDDESLFHYVLDFLERCCPSAAKYMASSADLQPRCPDAPDAATQCAQPFSEKQHNRSSSTEIVLRGVDNFGAFRHHLSLSPGGFLIDFHDAPPTLADDGGGIGLIIFGFTGATVFFNPKTAPELTKKIGLLLRDHSGFVMSYNSSSSRP